MSNTISIVTINFNNKVGLEKTIESVVKQTDDSFEYIIIDGGSSDGSFKLIEENAEHINYWVSEPDRGIYHAQNKGCKVSTGDFILFLNSGDCLAHNDVLKEVKSHLTEGLDILYGNLMILESNFSWEKKYNDELTFGYFIKHTLPHQAAFINRNCFGKVGLYEEALKLTADWKFFLDAVCKYNCNLKYIDQVITNYDHTGVSALQESKKTIREEKKNVLQREYLRFYFEHQKMEQQLQTYETILSSRAIKFYLDIKKILNK